MSAVAEKLSAAERDLLDHAEEKIQRGLDTFFEVGQALATVRDNRLYREQHGTFEEYCEQRWGFTDRRANQLVDAVTVLRLISGTIVPEINMDAGQAASEQVEIAVPANEAQVRPLAPLLPPPDASPEEKAAAEEAVREVWTEAVDTAPRDANGRAKVTGAHVAETVAAHNVPEPAATEEPAKPRAERRKPITDRFRDAAHQLIKDAERIERIVLEDRWPKNAAKVAPASRNDLRRAIDLLAAVADRVPD